MATPYSRLLKDMPQVDLNGSGLDAQFPGNLAVTQALLHQGSHLLFAAGQLRFPGFQEFPWIAEDPLFQPCFAVYNGAQAIYEGFRLRRAPQDSTRASLKKPQSLILRNGWSPNHCGSWKTSQRKLMEPLHYGRKTESLIQQDNGWQGALD